MILEWKNTGVIIEESPISGKFQLNNMYYIIGALQILPIGFRLVVPKYGLKVHNGTIDLHLEAPGDPQYIYT